MADTPEPGFVIEGATYPFPTLDSLDLDEAELLYLATGWGLEDFVFDPDDENADEVARRIIRPTTQKALARIAYRRKHPEASEKVVMQMAGKANAGDALQALLDSGTEEAPLEEQTPNETPSSSEESSSGNDSPDLPNETSGTDSTESSDEPADDLPTTATPESATSPATPELRQVV